MWLADRQTDRRARAASNARVGSTPGRRSGDLARGSHQPRPRAGNDESHPRGTKMSGFGAIHSFPAPFLPAPPTARAAHQLSPLPWAHPRARASRPRAHESPGYILPVPVLFTSSLSFSGVPLAPSKAIPRERSRGCRLY